MIGQIPMIVECDEWDNVLPNSATTVVNITTHVHEGDTTVINNITNIDNTSTHHHYNITNITKLVNESITNVVEKAVTTTVTEKIWGVSEAAFFWGTALVFFAVIAVAYFVYATITANKKEELKANAMGMAYGKLNERPRQNRIF
jgi:cbb3-type cytochrome oxidase subunit 3